MNIDQWFSCLSEAYEMYGKIFSLHIKEILLEKLASDDTVKNEVDKGTFQIQGESQNEVMEVTKEVMTRYFFRKVVLGETFGPIKRIKERFGNTIEENYGLSAGPFVNLANTYWTYKIEVGDLFPESVSLVLTQGLLWIEGDIASVFFPTPGPAVIWIRQRREMQRQFLNKYAPELDTDSFFKNGPFSGSSEGRIAQTVFNEKIWIRCPNDSCLRFMKIPNTVRPLRVTCPKCKMLFQFPIAEFNWLNHLEPNLHPVSRKVEELEILRHLWNIPDEMFAMRIVGSNWATRQVQEHVYAKFREEMPTISEKELLRAVFNSRALPPDPIGLGMTEEEVDKAMESINSLEDLTAYFIEKDEFEDTAPSDIFGVGAKIEEILSK